MPSKDLIIETVVKYLGKQMEVKIGNKYKKYNIAYIKIQEKTGKVETITLSDEVNIDISPDGKIYGIELLNANDQLKPQDNELVFTDTATGKKNKNTNWYKLNMRFNLMLLIDKPSTEWYVIVITMREHT